MLRICFLALLLAAVAGAQKHPFQDPKLPVEERITNLLSQMTLEEKILCLGTDPSVPRLGVVGSGHIEGLHGVALGGPAHWGGPRLTTPTTQFPQAVGLGEMWDPALLEQAAALEGQEARYTFQSAEFNKSGTRRRGGIVIRAPNADLARDPRWGRTEESYGEDAYLTGTMAVAFTRGLQGHDPKYWQAASLMKHFLANSNEEKRTSTSSNFDARLFREYYSVPFRMGIELGGARAFMTSYNSVNDVPMMINGPVLQHIVMKDWHFDGIICTDGGALKSLIEEHKAFPTMAEGAAAGVKSGINQFLDRFEEPIHKALDAKLLTEADITEALRGEFRVMVHLGLLDPPEQVAYAQIQKKAGAPDPWDTEEHHALAKRVTEESIVLLKNENNLLPLDRSALHTVAVLGPRANEVDLDWYSGTPPYRVTPLAGIQKLLGSGVQVTYVPYDADAEFAVAAAKAADAAIIFVGNHPTCNGGWERCFDPSEGKEAVDRKKIDLNPDQEALLRQVLAVNPKTVMVLVSSFPYAINWEAQNMPAILHMAHNSQEEGTAIAEALFGDINPGGRLVATWPRSLDQLPAMLDYNLLDGRTYMYFKGQPLFPFGYGLSYTTFQYGQMRSSAKTLQAGGSADIQVDVTNTGARAGDEVVQLYVTHMKSKINRPQEQLLAFRRVRIEPGKTVSVDLPLAADSLRYWDEAGKKWVLEGDEVELRIGSSSADIRSRGVIVVKGGTN